MLNIGKAIFEKEAMAKIIAVALLLLFFVFSFTFFLHLYAKCYLRPDQPPPPPAAAATAVAVRRRRRLHRLHFSQASRHGLDPTVLKSIPILTFAAGVHEKGMECAVCLSEVIEGETFRILPKCAHGFHVDCIDMWFQSHSTCPLCRNPVSDQFPKLPSETSLNTILENARGENARFPTNVLFWGNDAQVSTRTLNEEDNAVTRTTEEELEATSSSGMVAIDMPRQTVIEEEDEEQSATVTTRLRSLKRLLGRDSRVNPCRPSTDATLP